MSNIFTCEAQSSHYNFVPHA